MGRPNHYETLGVSPAASLDEIKKQYRALARRYHPDVAQTNDAADRFRLINEAYRILSDTGRRALYDSELKLEAMRRPGVRPGSPFGPPPDTEPPEDRRPPPGPSTGHHRSRSSGPHGPAQPPPRAPIDVLLTQAHVAFRRFRYREAEALCRQALRFDRRNVAVYELLGDVHKARGRQDEAIAMYSYALQLDHGNRSVQAKLDRIVGRPTGPTMSGSAARASRRAPPRQWSAPRPLPAVPSRALATGLGATAIVYLATTQYLEAAPPAPSGLIYEWDLRTIFALAASGAVAGFLLAMNSALARSREELGTRRTTTQRRVSVPLAAVLLGFGALLFYAAFLVYLLIAFLQDSVSKSILTAFTVSFGLVLVFALAVHASAAYVLLFGGNVVFLALIGGWALGDRFRRQQG